jgi:CSLREA domain-containing protein
MKWSLKVSIQILAVVTVLSLFTSACTLDDVLRALERLCAQTTYAVTTTADSSGGLCTASSCSLRDAVVTANVCPGTQTITVPAGTYVLTTTGAGEDAARRGDLDLTDSVNINGTGSPVVDGNATDRIFDILPGVTATLDGLVIRNGQSDDGGGIRNRGILHLNNSTVQNNIATLSPTPGVSSGDGGGILSEGDSSLFLHIVQILNNHANAGGGVSIIANGTTAPVFDVVASSIDNNSAQASGGGLWLDNAVNARLNLFDVSNNTIADQRGAGIWNASTLALEIGQIAGNRGGTGGGGIYNEPAGTITAQWIVIKDNYSRFGGGLNNNGTANITRSSIVTNTAERADGGGVFNDTEGVLTIDNTTLSGNLARSGGGIHNEGGNLQVSYSTIAANTPDGIHAISGGGMTVRDSILAGHLGGSCTGTLPTSTGFNIEDANTCRFTQSSDLANTDPLLQALILTVGPTPGYVHPLDLFSPAVDSADPAACDAQDEVGTTRPQGPHCDRGAFELEGGGVLPPPRTTVATIPAPGGLTLSHIVLPADQFYSGGPGCGPLDAKFQASVSDPSKASSVVLFFHLEDKAGNGSTPWNDGVSMQPDGKGGFSYDLFSQNIPAFNSYQEAWLVYQFVVTGPDGKVALRSEAFKDLTLSMCGKK